MRSFYPPFFTLAVILNSIELSLQTRPPFTPEKLTQVHLGLQRQYPQYDQNQLIPYNAEQPPARQLPERARVEEGFHFPFGFLMRDNHRVVYRLRSDQPFRVLVDAQNYVVGFLNRFDELCPLHRVFTAGRLKTNFLPEHRRDVVPMLIEDCEEFPQFARYDATNRGHGHGDGGGHNNGNNNGNNHGNGNGHSG